MKRFLQLVAAIKTMAAFAFTGGVMLVTVLSMVLGKESIPIRFVWQMIFLALIYGCLQLLAFSENTFRRINTPGRMAFLGISMLAVLIVFALIFQWFPAQNLTNWLVFVGLYIAVFFITVIALRTVFRLGGMKYNELLIAYKVRREN